MGYHDNLFDVLLHTGFFSRDKKKKRMNFILSWNFSFCCGRLVGVKNIRFQSYKYADASLIALERDRMYIV